jgi:16S rRNA (cytidine1402-2'-O)-methyltransferase
MSGTLYVVATPIGNLEDITLRALRVLREVDLIAAEDTRRTARLLAHFAISTPATSFHTHNAKSKTPQLVSTLQEGQSIALVTDAGTPGVSDPGVELVAACITAEIVVDPIPGASAPLTAAIGSGFPLTSLLVLGFAPSRSKDRNTFISSIASIPGVVTFFEAPHRIRQTLAKAADLLGERQIVVGRELTKVHQEFLRGTSAEVLLKVGEPKGEFTVVVGPQAQDTVQVTLPDDDALTAEFGLVAQEYGDGRRAAIARVARKYGRPAREIYAAIERTKHSGQ